jgi:hypothetical protein
MSVIPACRDPLLRKPTTGSVACCPRAASGHVAADTAIALTKSRRRIAFSKAQDCADQGLEWRDYRRDSRPPEWGFAINFALQKSQAAHVADGSFASVLALRPYVRSYSDSDRNSDLRARRLSATRDAVHRSKNQTSTAFRDRLKATDKATKILAIECSEECFASGCAQTTRQANLKRKLYAHWWP